jgi:hypothetical protein
MDKLDALSVSSLQKITGLKLLYLTSDKITADVKVLEKKLPNCKIVIQHALLN